MKRTCTAIVKAAIVAILSIQTIPGLAQDSADWDLWLKFMDTYIRPGT